MGIRRLFLLWLVIFSSQSLLSREIVVGIEAVPVKKMAILFTPIVLPDLISAKAAFEYRLHKKFNLVIPVEAKWMDYRWAIKWGSSLFGGPSDVPEKWYDKNLLLRVGWNIDMLQFKISSGLGAKWFPFSESMTNAFFVKTLLMAGYEHFNAYGAEGGQDSAVITHVLAMGYNWVKLNRFTFGFEVGEEYTWHTNPIKGIPVLISGLMPIFQFSLGFTF